MNWFMLKKHKNFSELIYAIQQSILSTNLILNRNSHVSLEEKYGFPVRGEKFSQSLLFLWKGYFYRNIHERQDVSKIRSIIFKLRLLSWHNFMKEKDMGHKVYLQYYEKSKNRWKKWLKIKFLTIGVGLLWKKLCT